MVLENIVSCFLSALLQNKRNSVKQTPETPKQSPEKKKFFAYFQTTLYIYLSEIFILC